MAAPRNSTRRVMMTLLILVVVVIAAFAGLGWWSHHGASNGAGQQMAAMASSASAAMPPLAPCGNAPNCLCSEATMQADPSHYVEPFELPAGDAEWQWQQVRAVVVEQGGAIVAEADGYLHATVTSALFRFVDDLEVRRDGAVLQLRSASRVGYSDMGANGKRLTAFKARLREALVIPAPADA